VITATPEHDRLLRERLEALTQHDSDYWSFRGDARREHGHGFLHYPAMMVPQVARAVLTQACAVHPDITDICDPFAGSGTVLTESMLRGLSFSGIDINPLAILLCRTKAGPFFLDALEDKSAQLKARILEDRRNAVEAHFTNRNKWFQRDVQIALSRIRRAIAAEESDWARRFFWICLAGTVRLVSNSRTSTVKLHIRPQDEITKRHCAPAVTFDKILDRNLQHLKDQFKCLNDVGYLNRGHYRMSVTTALGDIRTVAGNGQCDMVLTSPPYGDNATTVPYGQYSYLPLQWIEMADIDSGASPDHLRSTHAIDAKSLGGSRRLKKEDRERLIDLSPSLGRYLEHLKDQPADRAGRVTAFFRDLDACLPPILGRLRKGGLMVWTLGNRKVGGERVPLDAILSELLAVHHARLLCKLNRRIPSKRMAIKNNIADTISTETILVMRKAT